MMKWREKLTVALLSVNFLIFIPNGVNAQHCDPYDNLYCSNYNDCCFDLNVDYLCWKPCIDDLDFAYSFQTSNGDTSVTYKTLCPDWEPGIRIYLGKPSLFCDWNFGISWTYIKSDESTKLEAPSKGDVSSALLHLGLRSDLDDSSGGKFKSARGNWELSYHEGNALISYDISCNHCHEFSPFLGVTGVYIDQKLTVNLTNPSGVNNDDSAEIEWNSEYWGVGLRVGSHYQYRFNDSISFFVRANGTILAGEDCSKNKQEVTDGHSTISETTGINFKHDTGCHCVPGYHLASGFICDTCICNYAFTFRLGYEFLEWHNIPNHRVFSGEDKGAEASHSSSPSTRTLGFHGLFAGLMLSF